MCILAVSSLGQTKELKIEEMEVFDFNHLIFEQMGFQHILTHLRQKILKWSLLVIISEYFGWTIFKVFFIGCFRI